VKCTSLESSLAVKENEISTLKKESDSVRDEAHKLRQTADVSSAKLGQLEAKLKDLQSEYDCQRHNAESTRISMEKKLKEQVCWWNIS